MTVATIDPTAYRASMNPRERKDWRRQQRAAGRTVLPCPFCGLPLPPLDGTKAGALKLLKHLDRVTFLHVPAGRLWAMSCPTCSRPPEAG